MRQLTLRISKELHEALKIQSAKENRPITEIARELFKEYLEERK